MKKMQPLIYAILIVIGILIGSFSNGLKISGDSKINNILQMINEHYVDSVDYIKFENDAINSILSGLDPHSSFISINDVQAVEEDMQGSFSGIGVEFNIIEDSIVVISPISGGPSEKLGIQSGDRIISVEKEDVASTGIKNEEVFKLEIFLRLGGYVMGICNGFHDFIFLSPLQFFFVVPQEDNTKIPKKNKMIVFFITV